MEMSALVTTGVVTLAGAGGENVTGVVHHSDAGSQYTSIIYRGRLDDIGALASIGTRRRFVRLTPWRRARTGSTKRNASATTAHSTRSMTSNSPHAAGCTGHDMRPQLYQLRHTHRARKCLLPSQQPRTAPANRRTQPPLNPGLSTRQQQDLAKVLRSVLTFLGDLPVGG